MAKELIDALSEIQRAEVADQLLPGILVFLDKLLRRERISDELEAVRLSYVAILQSTSAGESHLLRKNVESLTESLYLKYESGNKFGRIRERRLINIRQFNFKQNQRRQERRSKMGSNDDSRLVTHTDDKSRLPPKAGRKLLTVTSETESGGKVSGQVSLGTDDESRYLTTTDDERRVSYGGEAFIELSKSQIDFTALKYAKLTESSMIKGYLYHKESDGLKERWLAMDGGVLKCFKKQHQSLLFEINLSEGGYSAIEGRIGKMFAIRLSGTRAFSSHLFASPKIEIIASWLMTLSEAGVRLQDEILREVSMNRQNNNKAKSQLDNKSVSETDEFHSGLLEALEFVERKRTPCILPKRSSYSFKELDVLKKLKSSIVAKKAESKLNRRKTWSAGSFPISSCTVLEKFRKPISDGDIIDPQKEKEDIIRELASKSLPEILTSSGVVPVTKPDVRGLEMTVENEDENLRALSEEDLCSSKSMPEGLNKNPDADVIDNSPSPRESFTAQSVPDLLIHPSQESSVQPSSLKTEERRQMKPSISLTRVVSMKASLMKNALISGWKRKGRRGSAQIAFDPKLSDIYGCLLRKKGQHWKLRWCVVRDDVFYAYRDSGYTQEDFKCSLRKCNVVSNSQESSRANAFQLVRRRGEEFLLAAEDCSELDRWLPVLQRQTSKHCLSEGPDSRSSSLTVSLFGSDAFGDSSAAEDTPPEKRNSNYCETTDKDSSDEHSTTSSISARVKSRGSHEKGYVYYLVKQDTWEHCWMEVSFGVLSIYNSDAKETALQRDHVALCDIQHDSTDGQRSYTFVLKKPSRHPVYFAVNSEHDFVKWQKCFNSWRKRKTPDEPTEVRVSDMTGHSRSKGDNVIPSSQNYLTIPMSDPAVETPVTSDSDYWGDGQDSKHLAERPKIRRPMTDDLQITPKLNRGRYSSIGTDEASPDTQKHSTAVKSSLLYYKASSGLWEKYWCVLDTTVIYGYYSPEDSEPAFSVKIPGCEIRRTSCKSKKFSFGVFDRTTEKHDEFAAESTHVMYAWMRVLNIASGLGGIKDKTSAELSPSKSEDPGATQAELSDVKIMRTNTEDVIMERRDNHCDHALNSSENITASRTSLSPPTSPKKTKITSLDEVLNLLHEKRLEQELLTKQQTKSERARTRWQHSMLVALRKKRSGRMYSSAENLKSSGSFGFTSPEQDEKAAKVKYREISAKYDGIIEDERLKILRRETLLKKRRNSLILRKDILQRKLSKFQDGGKTALKKRQSKLDAKGMLTSHTKGELNEDMRQLADIDAELERIKQEIADNHSEQRKVSEDLNEQKRKELHELRVNADMSPQTSKAFLQEGKSLRGRRTSDSSVNDTVRKMKVHDDRPKLALTHTLSTPASDMRVKAKSFSSSGFSKTKSSPLLRTKTYDSSDGLKRPNAKMRASQEALSIALSQIEDFEAFVQEAKQNCGADVGC